MGPRFAGEATEAPIDSWIEGFGVGGQAMRAVVENLRPAGVHLQRYEPARPMPALGVVAFEVVAARVCDFVRAASRFGERRVLALATRQAPMPADRAWELLHAGASDVMSWTGDPAPAAQIAARLRRWRAVDELVASRAV